MIRRKGKENDKVTPKKSSSKSKKQKVLSPKCKQKTATKTNKKVENKLNLILEMLETIGKLDQKTPRKKSKLSSLEEIYALSSNEEEDDDDENTRVVAISDDEADKESGECSTSQSQTQL